MTVFLVLPPDIEFPADAAAAVYIRFPGTGTGTTGGAQAQEFELLGALGRGEMSAVFRVDGPEGAGGGGVGGLVDGMMGGDDEEDEMIDDVYGTTTISPNNNANPDAGSVVIGISIEPAAAIAAQLAAVRGRSTALTVVQNPSSSTSTAATAPPPAITTKLLAQRIIKNAFNFLASFASGTQDEVVPLKSFQDWWAKFERRIENDPGFLERQGDDG